MYGLTDGRFPPVFYSTLSPLVPSGARGKTSCPKARDAHRYPCPALVFCHGSCYVSRAAALEGTGGDKVLLNTGGICTSVRTYVRPSPPRAPQRLALAPERLT